MTHLLLASFERPTGLDRCQDEDSASPDALADGAQTEASSHVAVRLGADVCRLLVEGCKRLREAPDPTDISATKPDHEPRTFVL
jgi:hypothetical protein